MASIAKSFQFVLFDYSGQVIVETSTTRYTYEVDGAFVRVCERMARYTPGKALNYLKDVCINGPKKESTMKKPLTEAGEVIMRKRAVHKREAFMKEHGNFILLQSDKGAVRMFPAPCEECGMDQTKPEPLWKISGLLFYKWVRGDGKLFDKLIIHTVCYRCGEKSKMYVFEPYEYKVPVMMFNPLWMQFNVKWHHLR